MEENVPRPHVRGKLLYVGQIIDPNKFFKAMSQLTRTLLFIIINLWTRAFSYLFKVKTICLWSSFVCQFETINLAKVIACFLPKDICLFLKSPMNESQMSTILFSKYSF